MADYIGIIIEYADREAKEIESELPQLQSKLSMLRLEGRENSREYQELYNYINFKKINLLFDQNIRLVPHIAKKFESTRVDKEELVGVGSVGLLKGAKAFDPERKVKAATYLSRCIENEILMHLRRLRKYRGEVFMFDPIGTDKDGNSLTLMDVLHDDINLENSVIESAQFKEVSGSMKFLSIREREILRLRYNDDKRMTQRQIAKKLGISRSYVSRIEKRAIPKLRDILREKYGEAIPDNLDETGRVIDDEQKVDNPIEGKPLYNNEVKVSAAVNSTKVNSNESEIQGEKLQLSTRYMLKVEIGTNGINASSPYSEPPFGRPENMSKQPVEYYCYINEYQRPSSGALINKNTGRHVPRESSSVNEYPEVKSIPADLEMQVSQPVENHTKKIPEQTAEQSPKNNITETEEKDVQSTGEVISTEISSTESKPERSPNKVVRRVKAKPDYLDKTIEKMLNEVAVMSFETLGPIIKLAVLEKVIKANEGWAMSVAKKLNISHHTIRRLMSKSEQELADEIVKFPESFVSNDPKIVQSIKENALENEPVISAAAKQEALSKYHPGFRKHLKPREKRIDSVNRMEVTMQQSQNIKPEVVSEETITTQDIDKLQVRSTSRSKNLFAVIIDMLPKLNDSNENIKDRVQQSIINLSKSNELTVEELRLALRTMLLTPAYSLQKARVEMGLSTGELEQLKESVGKKVIDEICSNFDEQAAAVSNL